MANNNNFYPQNNVDRFSNPDNNTQNMLAPLSNLQMNSYTTNHFNSNVASKINKSSFVQTTEEFHFRKLYISLALLTSSFFFSLIFAFFYLIKVITFL